MPEFAPMLVDGLPMIVFHGSPKLFADFRAPDHGIFFASSKATAAAYAQGYDGEEGSGHVISALIAMERPLRVDRKYLEAFAVGHSAAVAVERARACSNLSFPDAFEDSEHWARQLVIDRIKKDGHDGIIIDQDLLPVEHMGGDWEPQRSFAVFSEKQIRRIDTPGQAVTFAQSARAWLGTEVLTRNVTLSARS